MLNGGFSFWPRDLKQTVLTCGCGSRVGTLQHLQFQNRWLESQWILRAHLLSPRGLPPRDAVPFPGASGPPGTCMVSLHVRCLRSPASPAAAQGSNISDIYIAANEFPVSFRLRLADLMQHAEKRRQSWKWAAETTNLSYCTKIYSVCCLVS